MKAFSISSLALRGLWHYRRTHLLTAAGVAVAVAALVGALTVGDSIKGTLRQWALARLGRVDCAIVAGRFFRQTLAAEVVRGGGAAHAAPIIIAEGVARDVNGRSTVPGVALLGVPTEFFPHFVDAPAPVWSDRDVVLNAALAGQLGAKAGEDVLISVRRVGAATEGLFGRRDIPDTVATLRLRVAQVASMDGPGRFSLAAVRETPLTAFVPLSYLQSQLGQTGRVNAILGTGTHLPHADLVLERAAGPEDIGLRVQSTGQTLRLHHEGLVFPPALLAGIKEAAGELGLNVALASVYLANDMRKPGAESGTPYSIVAALTPAYPAPLAPDQIALSQWAADDMAAGVGDVVVMSFYQVAPEGTLSPRTLSFRVAAILPMEGPAVDPALVPPLKSITDAKTMAEWDAPFPIDMKRIRRKDEDFWDRYGAAPKAFIAPETMRRIWGGQADYGITAVRVDAAKGMGDGAFRSACDELVRRTVRAGAGELRFRPLREEAVRAGETSTDFGGLFLGMSFFLMLSAVMLAALLMRLTVERRAREVGVMMAAGWRPAGVRSLLLTEGGALCATGAAAGAGLGLAYAQGILYALREMWPDAVGGWSFGLHADGAHLLIGTVGGALIGLLAMLWALRHLRKEMPVRLLGGWRSLALRPDARVRRRALAFGLAGIAAAAASLVGLRRQPVPAFFLAGALMLSALMALARAGLQPAAGARVGAWSLGRLAWRGTMRNPSRSLLTFALMACAAFVLVVVSANRRDAGQVDVFNPQSGAGGYNLMARSELPLHYDLGSAEGRQKMGFSAEASRLLERARIRSFAMSRGQDISCLNIQRATAPQVVSVPESFIREGPGFAFSAVDRAAKPWDLLKDGRRAFVDAASAQWGLHVRMGEDVAVPLDTGRTARYRVAGLLRDSIFAGEMLVPESAFREDFGAEGGFRLFLIRTAPEEERAVADALQATLGDLGLRVTRTADLLRDFGRVQNAYLGAFQALGGLGLLLGCLGMTVVLVRQAEERRQELAMLSAIGLPRRRLAAIMVIENTVLLLAGTAAGVICALVAVAPQLVSAQQGANWASLIGTLSLCVSVSLLACCGAAVFSIDRSPAQSLRTE